LCPTIKCWLCSWNNPTSRSVSYLTHTGPVRHRFVAFEPIRLHRLSEEQSTLDAAVTHLHRAAQRRASCLLRFQTSRAASTAAHRHSIFSKRYSTAVRAPHCSAATLHIFILISITDPSRISSHLLYRHQLSLPDAVPESSSTAVRRPSRVRM